MHTTRELLNIILLNDTAYVNGGAAHVAIMEANALAERGYKVTFFCCDDGGPEKSRELRPDIRLVSTGQPEILHGSRAKAFIQGIHNQHAATVLNQLLKQFDPTNTVVHLHAWNKALSTSVLKPIKQKHFPMVCTLHDYTIACPNGTFYNHQQGSLCPLKPMSMACITTHCDSRSYSHKLWRVGRRYAQEHWHHLFASVDQFLAPSEFARKILAQHMPGTCRLDVLPNAVEVEKAPPVDVANNTDFYYVGRLSPEKGVVTFLEAAKLIGITAVVIGDGPSAGQLKEAFPRARFLGWLPPNEVRQSLRNARALIFPSICYETEGLVSKESASLGVPIIISDKSAPAALYEHNTTSVHFKSGDSSSLVQAMRHLQNSPNTANRLGKTIYHQYWDAPATLSTHTLTLQTFYLRLVRESAIST